MFNVLIDYREDKQRIINAGTYYESQGDDVLVRDLPVGDYLFNEEVVFEYKSLDDFIQSVESGRVFNQAIDQSTEYKYHFVIIVASDDDKHIYFDDAEYPCFGWGNYHGAIARLNTYTTVIECSSETEAIHFMRTQARKCLDNKHIVKKLGQKTDNPVFNYLLNIKSIGEDTAALIVDSLDLYDLEDLLSLDNRKLESINGIGCKTANIIMDSIRKKEKC